MKTKNLLKRTALAAGIFLIGHAVTLADPDSFIKQWKLVNGVQTLVSTIYFSGPADGEEATGTKTSEYAVGEDGSFYELWTLGIGSDTQNYLLDTSYVAGYAPKAEVKITSIDTYPVARTRANEVFKVDIFIEGLQSPDTGAPDSALNVYLRYSTEEYETDTNGPAEGSTREDENLISDGFISENGWIEPLTGGTQLGNRLVTEAYPDGINYTQRGQDIFRCYAFGPGDVGLQVAEGTIQVWPIGQASLYLKNYDVDATLTQSLPPVELTLRDIYPYSTTYIQIYKGEKDGEGRASAQVIETTRRNFNTTVPQSLTLTFSASVWKDYVPDDGTYTMEVITHTPFEGLAYPATGATELATLPTTGGLRLVHNTFTVDRTVKVIGNISSGAEE